MKSSDPSFVAMLTASNAIAAMLWLGLKHRALEPRTRRRKCPACGRLGWGRGDCSCST